MPATLDMLVYRSRTVPFGINRFADRAYQALDACFEQAFYSRRLGCYTAITGTGALVYGLGAGAAVDRSVFFMHRHVWAEAFFGDYVAMQELWQMQVGD